MLIVMKPSASAQDVHAVVNLIQEIGLRPSPIRKRREQRSASPGNQGAIDGRCFENLPGVADVIRVTKPYKLITLDLRPEKTVVRIGNATIGSKRARDHCGSVRDREPRSGIRGGRSSAEKRRAFLSWQRVETPNVPLRISRSGRERMGNLTEIRKAFGLKIVTEALEEPHIGLIEQYGDVIQIGARNMQNFSLLRRAGRSQLPVLLKRGMAATLEEWLLAAEYIMAEGNYNVILCERGVRTFTQHTRNTLDLASVPAIRRISHLPVIVDPSHGTGSAYMVTPLARAGVAVGADGLMVEVHNRPELALSDGAQALTPPEYAQLLSEVRAIREVTAPIANQSRIETKVA